MAMDLNSVSLLGNVGVEPEIKTFDNGGTIAQFSLATNRSWKDKKTGERKEHTEWHRIVVNNKGTVDFVAKHVTKGTRLLVSGELRTRKFTDKDGNDRWMTEVMVPPFTGSVLIQSKWKDKDDSGSSGGGNSSADDFDDDDIPF